MFNNQNFCLQNKVRPILKWAGGKSSLLSQLVPHFPKKFNRYMEPFFGGGAVFFSLAEGIPAIINDSNPNLFNLYSVIRDFPHELNEILKLYTEKYSEEFYYELRNTKVENKIEEAAKTLFLNKTCFNGLYRQNSKGEFNVPFGKRIKCPALSNLENILFVSQKLKKANLFNEDFEKILSISCAGDFIYCDPPYEPLSRTSSFNSYTGLGFSQKDQERLYESVKQASLKGATIALSHSSAPFILNLYKEFKIHKILARRSINSNGAKRGKINEVLILIP
jgi:DNA adenine methylase